MPIFPLLLALSAMLALWGCNADTSAQSLDSGDTSSISSSSIKTALSASSGIHKTASTLTLPVVYRDFPVTAPGFEFFDVDSPLQEASYQCANSTVSVSLSIPGALAICADSLPCVCPDDLPFCTPSQQPDFPLFYGEVAFSGLRQRGYTQSLKASLPSATISWQNASYLTYGMVAPTLAYGSIPKGADSLAYGRPAIGNAGRCHNDNLEQWFTDLNGINKRLDDSLVLTAVGDGFYEYKGDWNNATTGFYPLDAYAGEEGCTYGPQSLNIWCPQTSLLWPEDGCSLWRELGGPKNGKAAQEAATQYPTLSSHLRNFGFTMTLAFRFAYHAGTKETLAFDADELWVFVDGRLVGDLGGAHNPVPLVLDMDALSTQLGNWKDGSIHTLHVFFAERQSNESIFNMRTNLSEIF